MPSSTQTESPSAASALGVTFGATTCVTVRVFVATDVIVRLASLATQTW